MANFLKEFQTKVEGKEMQFDPTGIFAIVAPVKEVVNDNELKVTIETDVKPKNEGDPWTKKKENVSVYFNELGGTEKYKAGDTLAIMAENVEGDYVARAAENVSDKGAVVSYKDYGILAGETYFSRGETKNGTEQITAIVTTYDRDNDMQRISNFGKFLGHGKANADDKYTDVEKVENTIKRTAAMDLGKEVTLRSKSTGKERTIHKLDPLPGKKENYEGRPFMSAFTFKVEQNILDKESGKYVKGDILKSISTKETEFNGKPQTEYRRYLLIDKPKQANIGHIAVDLINEREAKRSQYVDDYEVVEEEEKEGFEESSEDEALPFDQDNDEVDKYQE